MRTLSLAPPLRSCPPKNGSDEGERVRHSCNQRQGSERRTPVTLFTVQLELGPETRAMIERVAANAVMHLELGPETRETIKAALPLSDSNKKEGVAGVLRKGADAARRK